MSTLHGQLSSDDFLLAHPYDYPMTDPGREHLPRSPRNAVREPVGKDHTWAAIAEAAGLTPHGVRYALGYSRKSTGGE